MDARLTLALMAKTEQVFARPGVFMSFPLAPLALQPDDLDLFPNDVPEAKRDVEARRILRNLSEFSLQVNLIPQGIDWPPTDTRLLWDVLEGVSGTAKLAKTTLSPGEQVAMMTAINFLYQSDPGGGNGWIDSPAVLVYKRYRDLHESTVRAYTIAEGEAAAAGTAAQAYWQNVDKPRFAEAIAEAERLWIVSGNKFAVEDQRRILDGLGRKDPRRLWDAWWMQFNSKVDRQNDLDNLTFFTTLFSPESIQHQSVWLKLSITRGEADVLQTGAPAPLRARFGGGPSMAFESLSFEYTSLTIQRPWFPPDALAANFWRFADPSRLLSDGGDPPVGPLTAYVTGLVLVRRIDLVDSQPATVNPADPVPHDLQPVRIGPLPVIPRPKTGQSPFEPRPSPTRDFTWRREISKPAWAPQATHPAATIPLSAGLMTRLSSFRIQLPPGTVLPPSTTFTPPPSPSSSASASPVEGVENDEPIYVLAMLCKRVGRCPHPAPNLNF